MSNLGSIKTISVERRMDIHGLMNFIKENDIVKESFTSERDDNAYPTVVSVNNGIIDITNLNLDSVFFVDTEFDIDEDTEFALLIAFRDYEGRFCPLKVDTFNDSSIRRVLEYYVNHPNINIEDIKSIHGAIKEDGSIHELYSRKDNN